MKKLIFVITIFTFTLFTIGCAVKTTTNPIQQTTTTPVTQTTTADVTQTDTERPKTTPTGTYTINWEVNGVIVEVDSNVLEGTLPVFNGDTPTKASTVQYDYTFSGWSPEVTNAQANQTYVAQFTETLRQYTLFFNTNGGTTPSPHVTQYYGDILLEPEKPTNEGFRFMGWFIDAELTQPVIWPFEVTQDQTFYAKWNALVPYGAYLEILLTSYSFNPYNYIPESMMPESNLTSQATLDNVDYSTFMSISQIPFGGHGEQWKMVIANIEQSKTFFNVLTIVDTLATLSVATFNNYLDTNPDDTAHYNFLSGIYSVTISFENEVISYTLDYTATLPGLGEQTVQIALSYNIVTGVKEGRVQLGDANALRYIVTPDSYQFAIKYLGIRRAYFEISEDHEGNIKGKIYEFLGLDEVFTFGSAAQFFITDDFVSVVGNKSSSMLGWEGTINELYSVSTGKLLGYEIRETLSSITYNTLWFNLNDTSGINSIKFLEAPLENSNPYLVYINDVDELFVTKNVGGIGFKMLSRRYDIELRQQYFYYMDGEELYQVPILVPMIFVQEEQLSSFVADVNSMNDGLTFAFNLSTLIQNQIMDDYDNLIDDFIGQKDLFTTQTIIDFIGSAYIHE